jgi:hypothetical protein
MQLILKTSIAAALLLTADPAAKERGMNFRGFGIETF